MSSMYLTNSPMGAIVGWTTFWAPMCDFCGVAVAVGVFVSALVGVASLWGGARVQHLVDVRRRRIVCHTQAECLNHRRRFLGRVGFDGTVTLPPARDVRRPAM